jgi:phenylalanyl-tRNA synthetase beta chain
VLASLNFVEKFLALPKVTKAISLQGSSFERVCYDIELLSPLLTTQGFEVEKVISVRDGFDSVVVGKIVEALPHPNAQKLQICQVDVGESSLRQIVCGARNARKDLFVAVALPGAVLPGDLNIKASKIRDVDSFGMLCSRAELGLPIKTDLDGDGIWELEVEAQGGLRTQEIGKKLGQPLFDALGLRDTLLELNVTPNRPDMLCHMGVAREIAAGLQFRKLPVQWKSREWETSQSLSVEKLVSQVLENSSAAVDDVRFECKNELGISAFFVVVDGVVVGPSQAWVRNLLESLGQNSVNNVVDCSNLLLLGYGHPNHAFDLDKLAFSDKGTKTLTLRAAKAGEKFLALDGKLRELDATDCVVADAENVQALLGVIGGEHSKVDAGTKKIVLEFANANPVAVRRSSRRHGRRTDSSFAFEKGIDATDRFQAAHVMLGLVGFCSQTQPKIIQGVHSKLQDRGEVARSFVSDAQLNSVLGPALSRGVCVDFSVLTQKPGLNGAEWNSFCAALTAKHTISFSSAHQKQVIGTEPLSFAHQLEILATLGFGIQKVQEDKANVQVPHWRWHDVCEFPDLVEEYVRVLGIDAVVPIPIASTGEPGKDDLHYAPFEVVSNVLSGLGYCEVAGYHFMRADDLERLGLSGILALGEPVALKNPILQDEPLMHTSLVPDLLRKIARNLGYGVKSGQLFHLCRTYQNRNSDGERFFQGNGLEIGLAESLKKAQPEQLEDYSSLHSYAYTREASQKGRPAETPRLSGVLFGVREEKNWQNNGQRVWDLHTVIAHVLSCAQALGVPAQHAQMPASYPFVNALHPWRRAVLSTQINGKDVIFGWVGQLHPKALRNFEIGEQVFAFELNLSLLSSAHFVTRDMAKRVVAPRRFPAVSRDFAFLFNEEVSAASLQACVHGALAPLLKEGQGIPARILGVQIFDIYRGQGVPPGKKSVAFNIVVEPLERTLTDADIQKLQTAVIGSVSGSLSGELRG